MRRCLGESTGALATFIEAPCTEKVAPHFRGGIIAHPPIDPTIDDGGREGAFDFLILDRGGKKCRGPLRGHPFTIYHSIQGKKSAADIPFPSGVLRGKWFCALQK